MSSSSSSAGGNRGNQQSISHAVWLILLQYGVIEANNLLQIIDNIKSDFGDYSRQPIDEIFKKLNKEARPLSLEIKSVAIKNSKGDFVYYHGVVNTHEDEVAKQFGGSFSPNELKFFTLLVLKLIEQKHMVTDEIKRYKEELVKHGKIKEIEGRYLTDGFLTKLEADKWLRRDDSNRWVVGIKTFLELKSYVETAIMNSVEDNEDNSAEMDIARAHVNDLPQIILY
jgi:hypothetical protein